MPKNTKTPNKYLYGWKFYLNYGGGWEYEIFEETYKGMLENKRLYQDNCKYPLKITRGRELNPEWETLQCRQNDTTDQR